MWLDGTDEELHYDVAVPQSLARRAWTLFEPIHAIVYFAPEAKNSYAAAGLRGGWMGYFASRSAPMGAVSGEVVTAVFHNFRPSMVMRAIPDAWTFASPERVLEARLEVADAALRRLWGLDVYSDEVNEAAATTLEIAAGLHGDGRPLYAGHAGLEVPELAHLALWHACTLLREHRFDGHIAALTVNGLDGIDALVLASAAGTGMDVETIQQVRGWTEDEIDAAWERLRERGLVDAGHGITSEGTAVKAAVEETTDRLAVGVWEVLGESRRERLFDLLHRLATRLEHPEGIRYPNPIGVSRPV
jgi:hypothetical protein